MDTFCSVLQLENAFDSINFTEEGIDISINESHPLKEYDPIDTTEYGIDIRLIKEHLEKSFLLIFVIDGGNAISFNSLHPLKQPSGI